MKILNKYFGTYEMTWKRLIIFSIICGVYSALVLLIPVISDTALKEIGVGYECWFILAIFVVSNCKNTIDASFKCFIFFLISQPLIYLVQSPFVHQNLLAAYYKPWFIQTFLTIPGGAIAYQIKKDNWISTIILAVAGIFLSFSGTAFFIGSLNPFRISYTFYGLFLICIAVILSFIFCNDLKKKIIYIITVLFLGIFIGIFASKNQFTAKNYQETLTNENWRLASCTFNDLSVVIEDDILKITYYGSNSSGELTMINSKGEQHHYIISMKEGQLFIDKVDN